MSIKQSRIQQGSGLIKFIAIGVALIIGGLTAAGGSYFYQRSLLNREHDEFIQAVKAEVQAISMVRIPETKTELAEHISAMLDTMGASYEPHHVRVDILREQERMRVQVWYWRPVLGWWPGSQQLFYASAEKVGFASIADSASAQMITSDKTSDVTESAEPASVTLSPSTTQQTAVEPQSVEKVALSRYTAPLTGTDANFQELVLESPGPVLVYFWAEWCGYCRRMSPAVDAAAREFSGKITVVKIDVDRNPRVSSQYKIRGIPQSLLFKDGDVAGSRGGFVQERVLFAFLKEYLFE